MRVVAVLTAVVAVGILAGAGQTRETQESKTTSEVIRQYMQVKRNLAAIENRVFCKSVRKAIVYYRGKVWKYQDQLGDPRSPTYYPERKRNACEYKRFVMSSWRGQAREYRKEVHSHFTLLDFKVYDGNNAWQKAVNEAQKPYPGTKNWLLSCSSTEGGWGKWVPNSDGFPPGGWMQMYHSTWYTMWYGWYTNEGAYKYLKSKGYRIPRSAHSWYSPLGQALASAHGMLNGRRGEWHSTGCY